MCIPVTSVGTLDATKSFSRGVMFRNESASSVPSKDKVLLPKPVTEF